MKPIFYTVALLVAGAACYFTLEHNRKFKELQTERLQKIDTNKQVSANADVTEADLKKENGVLKEAEDKKILLTESIAALKSKGGQLERDVAELDSTLTAQKEEFSELDKALKEVDTILKELNQGGDNITYDTLPAKIEQIEEEKKQKIAKVEELETLVAAAEGVLAKNNEKLDGLVQRKVSRDARIGRNSMESVVTAVNQDWGFVVIGAGSNSGFTPQSTLIVQRDGRLIGRVRPSSIEPTQTIAEVDFESLATGVRLQPGDRVILEKPVSN